MQCRIKTFLRRDVIQNNYATMTEIMLIHRRQNKQNSKDMEMKIIEMLRNCAKHVLIDMVLKVFQNQYITKLFVDNIHWKSMALMIQTRQV